MILLKKIEFVFLIQATINRNEKSIEDLEKELNKIKKAFQEKSDEMNKKEKKYEGH